VHPISRLEQYGAFSFGLRPVDDRVCFCQCRDGASRETATYHRSSRSGLHLRLCRSGLGPRAAARLRSASAGRPLRRHSELRRSVEVWRRLMVGVKFTFEERIPTMKLATIILATAFALSSTATLAQAVTSGSSVATQGQAGTAGYGSVVAPSVGSYVWPSVGSTSAVPTWRNTGPAAPLPGVPAAGNAPLRSEVRR
jgi:hypothetical protein